MLKNLLIIPILLLSGCININMSGREMPQTATEFKAIGKTHASIQVTQTVIKRHFSKVVNGLNKKVNACFNYDYVLKNIERNSRRTLGEFRQKYRVKFIKKSKHYYEFVIQGEPVGPRVGSKMPKGGFYSIVGEIKRKNKKQTILTLYSGEPKASSEAIISWAKGKKKECPISY